MSTTKPWENKPPEISEYNRYHWEPDEGVKSDIVRKYEDMDRPLHIPIVKFGWEHYIVGPRQMTHAKAMKVAKKAADLFRAHMQQAADEYLAARNWERDEE